MEQIIWHTPGTDTCHSDHWKVVAPSITHRKSIEPFKPLSSNYYSRTRSYEWTNHPGVSLEMGADPLALCGNQHRCQFGV